MGQGKDADNIANFKPEKILTKTTDNQATNRIRSKGKITFTH